MIAELKASGNFVTAIGTDRSTLWTRDLADPVVESQVADLDGDEIPEAVIGLHGTILAFDTEGERIWSTPTGDGHLTKIKIANLFRKQNQQVIVLSSDVREPDNSRLSIVGADGVMLGNYRHHGPLYDVFVDQLTSRHGPKIVVSGMKADLGLASVFMLEPKKIKGDAPLNSHLWYGTFAQPVVRIRAVDCNNDRKIDIEVKTSGGERCIDFEGKTMDPKFMFTLLSPTRASRRR
jgi:hypothetical protein